MNFISHDEKEGKLTQDFLIKLIKLPEYYKREILSKLSQKKHRSIRQYNGTIYGNKLAYFEDDNIIIFGGIAWSYFITRYELSICGDRNDMSYQLTIKIENDTEHRFRRK